MEVAVQVAACLVVWVGATAAHPDGFYYFDSRGVQTRQGLTPPRQLLETHHATSHAYRRVNSGATPTTYTATRTSPRDSSSRYVWSYEVAAPSTGDRKAAREERRGDMVVGQYSLVDPSGTFRVVDYVAGPETGFRAIISTDESPAALAQKAAMKYSSQRDNLHQPITNPQTHEQHIQQAITDHFKTPQHRYQFQNPDTEVRMEIPAPKTSLRVSQIRNNFQLPKVEEPFQTPHFRSQFQRPQPQDNFQSQQSMDFRDHFKSPQFKDMFQDTQHKDQLQIQQLQDQFKRPPFKAQFQTAHLRDQFQTPQLRDQLHNQQDPIQDKFQTSQFEHQFQTKQLDAKTHTSQSSYDFQNSQPKDQFQTPKFRAQSHVPQFTDHSRNPQPKVQLQTTHSRPQFQSSIFNQFQTPKTTVQWPQIQSQKVKEQIVSQAEPAYLFRNPQFSRHKFFIPQPKNIKNMHYTPHYTTPHVYAFNTNPQYIHKIHYGHFNHPYFSKHQFLKQDISQRQQETQVLNPTNQTVTEGQVQRQEHANDQVQHQDGQNNVVDTGSIGEQPQVESTKKETLPDQNIRGTNVPEPTDVQDPQKHEIHEENIHNQTKKDKETGESIGQSQSQQANQEQQQQQEGHTSAPVSSVPSVGVTLQTAVSGINSRRRPQG